MSGLFYNLGKKVGPKVRKVQWIWNSVAGNEADTIKMENQVGRDIAREIRMQSEPDRDNQIQQMLDDTGSRLCKCVANELRTFSFASIKSPEPNAFALPGGYIFVTRSIIELCKWDRDETAFIIAHEMGHVIRKHAINRIMRDFAVTAAARVVPVQGAAAGWVKKVGMQYLESAYSQDLEFEADKLGFLLTEAAGFQAQASVKLLRRLGELKSSENSIVIGNYFSTHPPLEERVRKLNTLLKK
jgi:beta-barrel assembly-enhancing protease